MTEAFKAEDLPETTVRLWRYRLWRYMALGVALWTLTLGGACWRNFSDGQNMALELARSEAGRLFDKYALLMRPAQQPRDFHAIVTRDAMHHAHIASLHAHSETNAPPDPWETECLHAFEAGAPDRSSIESFDGQPYLRYMAPLRNEQQCLACHSDQGHSTGSVMGGISVSVPLNPYLAGESANQHREGLGYGGVWVMGLLGIGFSGKSLHKRITDHKLMVEALRESEQRYRILFMTSRDANMTSDPVSGKFTSCNPACAEMFGVADEAEFTSLGPWDLSPETQPDGRASAETLKEMVGIAMREGSHFFEWRHKRRGGEEFSSTVLLTRVRIGEQVFLQGTVRDITRQKQMEMELNQAQKLEAVGRLAAGIAHEINTPTQYVGDNLEFLRIAYGSLLDLARTLPSITEEGREGPIPAPLLLQAQQLVENTDIEYLSEQVPRAIEQSLEGIGRVATIVQAMKEFSHPGVAAKNPTDLNQCIRSTATVSRNEWKYVADLEWDLDPLLPLVSCLPGEFNQVILNLLVNAAHAIGDEVRGNGVPEGNPSKGVISVSTRRDGDWAEIRIRDTGTGIPEGVRDRVFDPFFTTKDVGRGTGQGLAMARNVIADKHGGTITFETEMGKGTVFIIRLPIQEV